MLIFKFAEYFLHQVFEGYETGRAAEFIHHNGHGLLLGKHTLHYGVGQHGVGGEDYGL